MGGGGQARGTKQVGWGRGCDSQLTREASDRVTVLLATTARGDTLAAAPRFKAGLPPQAGEVAARRPRLCPQPVCKQNGRIIDRSGSRVYGVAIARVAAARRGPAGPHRGPLWGIPQTPGRCRRGRRARRRWRWERRNWCAGGVALGRGRSVGQSVAVMVGRLAPATASTRGNTSGRPRAWPGCMLHAIQCMHPWPEAQRSSRSARVASQVCTDSTRW